MKKTMFTFFLCCSLLLAKAQIDTIHAQNHKLVLKNLKEGKVAYLVYFTDSLLDKRTGGDIWERTTKLITFQNHPAVEFTWKWLRRDSIYGIVINICDRKTLAPIYHIANYKNRGVTAYDFREGYMIPTDTIQNNLALKKPKLPLTIPIISWEQDLETYPLLPIKKISQQFDIAFFDPNEKQPTYHRYEVIGKEELQLNADTKIKCWMLKIEYGKGNYAIFWLTEQAKEVVKMKEHYNGKYRFKVRQY